MSMVITIGRKGLGDQGDVADNSEREDSALAGRPQGKRIILMQLPKNLMNFGSS